TSANVCVIGDPNQAIYGFRGADASCFDRFTHDHPQAVHVSLTRNYRSTGTIVTASSQLLSPQLSSEQLSSEPLSLSSQPLALDSIVREMRERITIHTAPTDRAEAEFVIQTIEQLLGGHSFFSIDSGRTTGRDAAADNLTFADPLSFADIAVLYRTDAQSIP